jgi:hypothetical protein
MEVVWPSAARALDLLRGAKVNQETYSFARLSSRHDRHKRSAERSLDDDDEDAFGRGHLPPNNGYGDLGVESFMAAAAATAAGFASEVYPKDLDLRGVPSANSNNNGGNGGNNGNNGNGNGSAGAYFASHERWPEPSSLSFAGTLSTSVLPQLYSTGLVDDCLSTGVGRISSTAAAAAAAAAAAGGGQCHGSSHGSSHASGGPRYPQYWNDYSAFPQLGMAYGGSVSVPGPTSHTPAPHSSGGAASHTPPIRPPSVYYSELYNVYSEAFFFFFCCVS